MVDGLNVAVLGAGLMGHGLTQVFAVGGADVAVYDPSAAALASVRDRVSNNLAQLGGNPDAVQRITPYGDLEQAVADADLVIEAGPENLELKQRIFVELDELTSPHAILATNTSVLPVGQIANRVSTRHRVVGTHWWNPPYLVPLVEVIETAETSTAVVDRTMRILTAVGKSPVHVRRDVPGFIGNRLQHALWREAVALVADGVCDAETVDTVVKQSFGLRLAVLGPLENADMVGLDLTLAIHQRVLPDLNRTAGPSEYLEKLVREGRLGMKTGQGFRHWSVTEADQLRHALAEHLVAAATRASAVPTSVSQKREAHEAPQP